MTTKNKNQILLILIVSFILVLTVIIFNKEYKISLLQPNSNLTLTPKNKYTKKIIYGFLPYWNLKKTKINSSVTHVAYFAISIDQDGNIIKKEKNYTEPGFAKINSQDLQNLINKNSAQKHLVITMFDNEKIEKLLNSEEAKKRMIKSLNELIIQYDFSGINIDIEYAGNADKQLRDSFTNLVKQINQHFKQKNNFEISISMYAAAVLKPFIWDVEQLNNYVDYIVIMAYDFHLPSSHKSGPIAPIFGAHKQWKYDINTSIKSFTHIVPNQKIILGIPFYGYMWQTTEELATAQTIPNTGYTQTLAKIDEFISQEIPNRKLSYKWEEEGLSPYITYTEDNKSYVIFFENQESLSYKLDYIKQLNLGGIAIWALGYETQTQEIWDLIETQLTLNTE